MKALFFCNSYNVLMASIQIKRKLFKNIRADILISDFSNNMEKISNNLEELNIFHKVYFCKLKDIYQGGNMVHKIYKTLLLLEDEKNLLERTKLPNLLYDIFFFNNYDLISSQIYLNIKKHNPLIRLCRVEEGYSTYTVQNRFVLLQEIMRVVCALKKIPTLLGATKEIFLYEPDLLMYPNNYNKTKIPKYSKHNNRDVYILNKVFGYKDEAKEYEKYSYILFEESFAKDKKENINDYELFYSIINKVGRKNVILKLHPRNDKNRFKNIPIGNSNLPWEIIQLNGNFEKSVFITISSGAVLASKLWLNDQVTTIFLYKCTNRIPKLVNNNYLKYFNKINNISSSDKWIVPETLEELHNIIDIEL